MPASVLSNSLERQPNSPWAIGRERFWRRGPAPQRSRGFGRENVCAGELRVSPAGSAIRDVGACGKCERTERLCGEAACGSRSFAGLAGSVDELIISVVGPSQKNRPAGIRRVGAGSAINGEMRRGATLAARFVRILVTAPSRRRGLGFASFTPSDPKSKSGDIAALQKILGVKGSCGCRGDPERDPGAIERIHEVAVRLLMPGNGNQREKVLDRMSNSRPAVQSKPPAGGEEHSDLVFDANTCDPSREVCLPVAVVTCRK